MWSSNWNIGWFSQEKIQLPCMELFPFLHDVPVKFAWITRDTDTGIVSRKYRLIRSISLLQKSLQFLMKNIPVKDYKESTTLKKRSKKRVVHAYLLVDHTIIYTPLNLMIF